MLRELIEEVLLLQTDWHHTKTPAMDRRGIIVRHEIPEFLRSVVPTLATSAGLDPSDTAVEGRDGTGPKTEVPWVRVHSVTRAPRATTGWYVVYLFSAVGDRCYLTLGHGSTVWTGVEFKPRPANELRQLAQWARNTVVGQIANRPGLLLEIHLDSRRSNLGPSYEAGTAVALEYDFNSIPDDRILLEDLQYMLSLLAQLDLAAESDPQVPFVEPSEVQQVAEVVTRAAGRHPTRRRSGQGFGLTRAEQEAVEQHAVAMAMDHYRLLGWTDLKDVGMTESYDISAKESGEQRYIEVKGTTSAGTAIILTPNEVALHLEHPSANALLVVHSISLDRSERTPKASGGTVFELRPWSIDHERLTPMGYKYNLEGL